MDYPQHVQTHKELRVKNVFNLFTLLLISCPDFGFFSSPSSHTFLNVARPHHVCIYLECTEPRKRDVIFFWEEISITFHSLLLDPSSLTLSSVFHGVALLWYSREKKADDSHSLLVALDIPKRVRVQEQKWIARHIRPPVIAVTSRTWHSFHFCRYGILNQNARFFVLFCCFFFTLVCAHENLYIMVKNIELLSICSGSSSEN